MTLVRTARAAARQNDVSVLEGMLAGIAGGAVMAIVAMLISWAAGTGLWSTLNEFAPIALGSAAAATGGPSVTLTGLAVLLGFSAMFGAVLVRLCNRVTHELTWTGVALGLGLWILDHYLVPAAVPCARPFAESQPAWLASPLHAIFGFIVAEVAHNASTRRPYRSGRRGWRSHDPPGRERGDEPHRGNDAGAEAQVFEHGELPCASPSRRRE
jgi:hypothetical protein